MAKAAEKTKEPISPKTKASKTKRFLWFCLKLSIIGLILLGFYTLYLDAKVVEKFEGQRWQIPVQVYGKIARYYPDSSINLNHVSSELKLLGYQKVSKVTKPGQYAKSSRRIIIFRRAFDFGSGVEHAQKIQIDTKAFADEFIVDKLFIDNEAVEAVELEPYLIDRIVPDSKEDRVLVPLQSVPEKLLDTLLLVEDRDFYFHAGVSPLGILRALITNIKAGRTVQGGSTLTQQLVKNMYLSREKTLVRKVNEAIMALLLEYRYSKDQLLEAYINEVYLGQHYANGIYGFGLAAEFYFGKNVAQLNDAQMATLIGVIKGPSYYDPWRYSERVKTRRDLVLKLMFEHDQLDKAEYLSAIESPLSIRKQRRFTQQKQKFPAYLQLVKQELGQLLTDDDQASGIRVFTNFSLHTQLLLEKTAKTQLAKLADKNSHDLQVAMVVTERETGAVNAIIGDKKSGYAGFNRALKAKRPIGSLIKPAIYISALERYQEYQLATLLEDKAAKFEADNGDIWRPKNYNGKFSGQASLLDSLVKSLNVPTVNLGMALGLSTIADVVHLLGYDQDITLRPSMLLGSINMSPYQINQFYLPLSNQGYAIESHAVERIVSAQGETYYQHLANDSAYFSEQASYLMNFALMQVAEKGTAKSLTWRLKNAKVAGKTGTTNDQRDSWYVGYDQHHLITTWLGRDDNKATEFTGSSGALTLYAAFMNQFGVTNIRPQKPLGVEPTEFEAKTGYAVALECPSNYTLPAISTDLAKQYSCSEPIKPKKKKSWLERLFGD